MPTVETEWSLQRRLTMAWSHGGVVMFDDEPLFLAAWEVMTDYRINDARRHWNRPSVDFVFLDRAGFAVLVELKREICTPRDAWSVLCQVTHRAHFLSIGYSQPRLEGAYLDCYSGADGRVGSPTVVKPLLEAHANAFGQALLDDLPGTPARRIVMATAYGAAFPGILSSFNNKTREQVTTHLGRCKPSREIKRYLDLPKNVPPAEAPPIRAVTVDDSLLTVDGRTD